MPVGERTISPVVLTNVVVLFVSRVEVSLYFYIANGTNKARSFCQRNHVIVWALCSSRVSWAILPLSSVNLEMVFSEDSILTVVLLARRGT